MNPTAEAVLLSWPFDPWVIVSFLVTAAIFLRGWFVLHRRDPQRWRARQPVTFLSGLACLFLAIASPIEPFTGLLLQVHMVQHLLLMMAAPPLLWLGTPLLPMLRGLPQPVRTYWVAPLFRWRWLRHCASWLTNPVPAWALFVACTWFWHLPPIYELALRSDGWHYLEHACFLLTALLFWYPVVRPFPCRLTWSRWLLLPYLLLADVQNTVLAALFAFSDQPFYSHYAQVPRVAGITAAEDQAAAGVFMWVPGSIAFLLPLFTIGLKLLFGTAANATSRSAAPRRLQLPLINSRAASRRPALDLLNVPLIGPFLKWRRSRLAFQLPLLVLAAVTIWDGLRGPQVAPLNLAGVLPWIHWRGLLVLGLLVAGNVFCFACPFLVPRMLARRFLPAGKAWPRRLRNKWPAIALLGLFLWSYEAFALWDSPWWTAWIAVGYFVAAFLIDAVFRGAAFCKYVCPIGQFNFVQSLVSPLEVRIRDPGVCTKCSTKDCIRGGNGTSGCELNLFLPRKAGNMDCTFCLDCVHACPHDNVAIAANVPGADLWRDPQRSGIGRFSRRFDVAALVLLLVFGAFANAAGMVAPVVAWQDAFSTALGQRTSILATSLFYAASLILLPVAVVSTAATVSRWFAGSRHGRREIGTRFVYALVPLGAAVWLAHYSFHLLTSYRAVLPASMRLAYEWGVASAAISDWTCACCLPVADWLLRLEIVALDFGLLASLYASYRIALSLYPETSRALRALTPWAVLLVLLFAAGVWIVLQPMEMRGTLQLAG